MTIRSLSSSVPLQQIINQLVLKAQRYSFNDITSHLFIKIHFKNTHKCSSCMYAELFFESYWRALCSYNSETDTRLKLLQLQSACSKLGLFVAYDQKQIKDNKLFSNITFLVCCYVIPVLKLLYFKEN